MDTVSNIFLYTENVRGFISVSINGTTLFHKGNMRARLNNNILMTI